MKEYYTEKDKKQVVIQTIKNLCDILTLYYNEEDIIDGATSFELLDDSTDYTSTQATQFIPLDNIMAPFEIRKNKAWRWIPYADIKKYLKKVK